MLIDARALAGGETFDADVCIVGGGAAGITLARELAAPGRRVALLESGGFEFDAETQELYRGALAPTVPEPDEDYLTTSRLRYLGGTSNHWEGWCRPFDSLDFEARDWVPMSGWPLARADLDPYYARACQHLNLRELGADLAQFDPVLGTTLFAPGSSLRTTFFQASSPMRFGETYRQEIVGSHAIDLYLWSNAVELVVNRDGIVLERVTVRTLNGKRFAVRARVFVLAAGAVEVARLLLASNKVHEEGIGNHYDLVGRFFMEHPRLEGIGSLLLFDDRPLKTYSVRWIEALGQRVLGTLAPSAEWQRRHRLLNTCFNLEPSAPAELGAEVGELARALAPSVAQSNAIFHVRVGVNCEQAPNRHSRVTLEEDDEDEFGKPRVRLEWRLSELDRLSVRTSLELLAREVARASLGRAAFFLSDIEPWRDVLTSSHQIGTTRMSGDPQQGVVDRHLRVFTIENLYVASTAVFPTSGLASPTLTLLALTIRLADHLKETLT